MATADENVEMSLTTTCNCYQVGNRAGYLGEVFAAAVVEVPRSSVMGKTEEQLREDLTARQYLALQDAARSACSLQASRNLSQRRMGSGSGAGDMHLSPMESTRVHCSADIRIRLSRR